MFLKIYSIAFLHLYRNISTFSNFFPKVYGIITFECDFNAFVYNSFDHKNLSSFQAKRNFFNDIHQSSPD